MHIHEQNNADLTRVLRKGVKHRLAYGCLLLQGQGGGHDVVSADGESSHTLHMQVSLKQY